MPSNVRIRYESPEGEAAGTAISSFAPFFNFRLVVFNPVNRYFFILI